MPFPRRSVLIAVCSIAFAGGQENGIPNDFFPLQDGLIETDEQTAENCPLTCPEGIQCKRGNQSLDGHPSRPSGGLLYFHKVLNQDGWHCDCPMGLTGVQCEVPYEKCSDDVHDCYHGGSCIPGLNDFFGDHNRFCNCERALDPNDPYTKYEGKYCEEEVKFVSAECAENNMCKNGGTCKEESDKLEPCECLKGFSGKHCQFVDETVPDCSKACVNDGKCRLGVDSSSVALYDTRVEYCECHTENYGEFCEQASEECGSQFCNHGSECIEMKLSNGITEHLCDCTKAYTEKEYFSGEFCQYPSTVFCSGHDDVNGRQFCTNGGDCPSEVHGACVCPPGFSGPRCAFEIGVDGTDYAECQLGCQNGGTCQKGTKNMEAYGDFTDDVSQPHEDYEHCVCPSGFYGIKCEYAMTACENEDHACFHGSMCTVDGEEVGCNCKDTEKLTAGLYCEFFASDRCEGAQQQAKNDTSEHRGFCTNEGVCNVNKEGDESWCVCPIGFEGLHCEFPTVGRTHESGRKDRSSDRQGISDGAVVAMVLIGSTLIGILLFIVFLPRRGIQHEERGGDGIRKKKEAARRVLPRDTNSYPASNCTTKSETSTICKGVAII